MLKVAKRSKTWLNTLNEEANQARGNKIVERSYALAGQFMNKNYLRTIKQKYRAPHVMGSQEVGDFLEMLAEAIYQTQGKSRVKLFELDKIFPLYPASRLHFDFD